MGVKIVDKKDLLPLQGRSLNGRISKLKKAITTMAHPVFLDRSLLYLESYRVTEGEHTIIRRAKALENILKKIPITIQSDQRIVGGRTPSPRMGVPATEGDVEWLKQGIS